MRGPARMVALAALLLGVGGGFVPIEPQRHDEPDDEPERTNDPEHEPAVERPIAHAAPRHAATGFGARAERRRQARAAQRGARC